MKRRDVIDLVARAEARVHAEIDQHAALSHARIGAAFTALAQQLLDARPLGDVRWTPLKAAALDLGVDPRTVKRWAAEVPGSIIRDASRRVFLDPVAVHRWSQRISAEVPTENADMPTGGSSPPLAPSDHEEARPQAEK